MIFRFDFKNKIYKLLTTKQQQAVKKLQTRRLDPS